MNKFEIFAADALALMGCQALEETIARRSTIAVSGEASASLGLLGRYREAMPGDCLRRGLRKRPATA
jgi:hypothetical protein